MDSSEGNENAGAGHRPGDLNPSGTYSMADSAAAADTRNAVRWGVALALGLRQGEALGLRWKYVDTKAGTIRVWWQLQRNTWQHGCTDPGKCTAKKHRKVCPDGCVRHASTCPDRRGGGLVWREPKGKKKRTVAFPAELVPLLEAQREAQDAERELARDLWEENDLCFAQPDGKPIDPRRDWAEWKALLKAAGVRDVRVHDGRHTAATLLTEQGVHSRVVMDVLGHSDLRLMQRYSHVSAAGSQDAAKRMGVALWGPAETPDSEGTETRTETKGPSAEAV